MSKSEKTFYNLTELTEIAAKAAKAINSVSERLAAIEKHIGIAKEKTKLEVGKWYKNKSNTKSIIYNTGVRNGCYGFNNAGKWTNEYQAVTLTGLWIEATPQEVEEAMVKEAKRRGYEVGKTICRKNVCESLPTVKIDKITFPNDNGYRFFESCIQSGKPFLEYNGFVVFSDGKWVDIIEEPVDKFAELKEAHRNGAVIQRATTLTWVDDLNPTWESYREYRIKPEEKPKIGDVCKFWDDDENAFVVAVYAELREDKEWDSNSFTYTHGVRLTGNYHTRFYKNAKPLTKQEAIELLFGKGD